MKTGKKMATGLWPSLEALATPAAVLAEWQMLTGDEFDRVRPYLCETDRQSDTFPCSNRPRCGCRHEIVDLDDGRIIAPCRCDHEQCTTLKLAPGDVVVHELDTASLCAALCETLELESVPPGKFDAAPRCHRVGTRGDAQTTVVLALATGEPALLAECGGLCAAIPNPFILLTPTGASFTPKIEAAVRRHQSIHIPLARHLALNGKSLSRAGEKVARGRKRCTKKGSNFVFSQKTKKQNTQTAKRNDKSDKLNAKDV